MWTASRSEITSARDGRITSLTWQGVVRDRDVVARIRDWAKRNVEQRSTPSIKAGPTAPRQESPQGSPDEEVF
eukprot:5894632-Amphidinium_carterae.1